MVGIAAGSQPIVGYNYGAGPWHRVRCIFMPMMMAEFCVGLISMICFEAFPLQIISIFGSEDGLYNEFAVLAFRIFLGGIVLCCIQKSCSIFLQSIGRPAVHDAVLVQGLYLKRAFNINPAQTVRRNHGLVFRTNRRHNFFWGGCSVHVPDSQGTGPIGGQRRETARCSGKYPIP